MEPFPLETDGHTTRGIPDIGDSATDRAATFCMFSLLNVLDDSQSKKISSKSKKNCELRHTRLEQISNCSKAALCNNNLNSHVKSQTANKRVQGDSVVLNKRSRRDNDAETPFCTGVIDSPRARKVFKAFKCHKNPEGNIHSLQPKSKGIIETEIERSFEHGLPKKRKNKCAIITKDKIVLTQELADEIDKENTTDILNSSDNHSSLIRSLGVNNTLGYKSSVPKVFILKESKRPLVKNKTHNKNQKSFEKKRSHSQLRPLCLSVIPASDVKKFKYEKSFGPFYFVQQHKNASGFKSDTALSPEKGVDSSNKYYISDSQSEEDENEEIFYDSKSTSSLFDKFETSPKSELQEQQEESIHESYDNHSFPKTLLLEQLKRVKEFVSTHDDPTIKDETQIKLPKNSAELQMHLPKQFKIKTQSAVRTAFRKLLNMNHLQGNSVDKNSLNEISSTLVQGQMYNCDVIQDALSSESQNNSRSASSQVKMFCDGKQPTSAESRCENERYQFPPQIKQSRFRTPSKSMNEKIKTLEQTNQIGSNNHFDHRRDEMSSGDHNMCKRRHDLRAKEAQTDNKLFMLSTEGSCRKIEGKQLSDGLRYDESHDIEKNPIDSEGSQRRCDELKDSDDLANTCRCEEDRSNVGRMGEKRGQRSINERTQGPNVQLLKLKPEGSMQVVKATMDVLIGVNLRPLTEP